MNKKQFSNRIGNIEDRIVQQAEQVPNYSKQHRQKRIRRLATTAAAVVLMVCSFSAGALVFAREKVVEVPVKQEAVALDDIGLTMILPESWRGRYSVAKNSQNYIVYNMQSREALSQGTDPFDGGVLFYIVCYDEAMTPEQFVENGLDFTAYRYLFSTSSSTYILHYASDVQFDLQNTEQAKEYQQMEAEVEHIQFIPTNLFEY